MVKTIRSYMDLENYKACIKSDFELFVLFYLNKPVKPITIIKNNKTFK